MPIETRSHKTKPATYRVYWKDPKTGKRDHKSFDDLLDAKAFDADMQRRLKKGLPVESLAPQEVTFRGLAALYIAKTPMAKSTEKSFFPNLLVNIFPHIPKKPVMTLTLDDVDPLSDIWTQKGLKQNSQYVLFSIIRAILNFGVKRRIIPYNPLKDWKVSPGVGDVIPPITKKELNLIYQNASPHIKRVIILATSLGCRVGQSELFKLRWEHVNFEERMVHVTSANKNKRMPRRDIFMNDRLYSHLRRWEKEDEGKAFSDRYIIYYKTNKKPLQTIFVAWKKALAAAGISRRIRPYDLRHLFATRTLSAGMPVKAVSEVMGHANPMMTLKVYQHVLDADRRAVVESSLLPDDDE